MKRQDVGLDAIRRSLYVRRVALGLTQAQVAERMKVTQSAVSDLENGRVEPMPSTLARWAEALGLRLRMVLEIDWEAKKGAA